MKTLLTAVYLCAASALVAQPAMPEWEASRGLYSGSLFSACGAEGRYVAASFQDVFVLDSGAKVWRRVPVQHTGIYSLAARGDTVLIGSSGGVIISTDAGNTWQQHSSLPDVGMAHLIAALDIGSDYLYAGSGNGLYRCARGANTWEQCSAEYIAGVRAVASSGDTVVAPSSKGGVALSTDKGATWVNIKDSLSPEGILSDIAYSGGAWFAAYDYFKGGVYRSTDGGKRWQQINQGRNEIPVHALYAAAGTVYCTTRSGAFFAFAGNEWQQQPLPPGTAVIGAAKDKIIRHGDIVEIGAGEVWDTSTVSDVAVRRFAHIGDTFFASGDDQKLYVSTDEGRTWQRKMASWIGANEYHSLVALQTTLVASTNTGTYKSSDMGNTWQLAVPYTITQPPPVYISFAPYCQVVDGRMIGFYPDGIYFTDDLVQWNTVGSAVGYVRGLGLLGNLWFAATDGAILRFQYGNSPTDVSANAPVGNIHHLTSAGSTLVAAASDGIYYSADSSKSWSVASGIPQGASFTSLYTIGNNVLAAGEGSEVYISYDDGKRWNPIGTPAPGSGLSSVYSANGVLLAASSSGGVFRAVPPPAQPARGVFPPDSFVVQGADTVLLVWNSAEGAVKYHLQVEELNIPGQYFVDNTSVLDTFYTVAGLKPSTEYRWRVRSVSMAERRSGTRSGSGIASADDDWSEWKVFRTDAGTSVPEGPPRGSLVAVWPQPASGVLNVSGLPPGESFSVSVYDAASRLLWEGTSSESSPEGTLVLRMPGLLRGAYVLRLVASSARFDVLFAVE